MDSTTGFTFLKNPIFDVSFVKIHGVVAEIRPRHGPEGLVWATPLVADWDHRDWGQYAWGIDRSHPKKIYRQLRTVSQWLTFDSGASSPQIWCFWWFPLMLWWQWL